MLHLGYLGFEEGGQLTEKVRRHPYSIILFDEIEKAHQDVLNILLQILEDGILTDSQGRKVSFKNTIIILTSNIGANLIANQKVIGFTDIIKTDRFNSKTTSINDNIKKDVLNEVKKYLRPEFINRIDDVIIFNKLSKIELEDIASILLNNLVDILKKNNLDVDIDSSVANYVVNDKDYNLEYGARPIRRIIQNKIENVIANGLLEKKFGYKDKIKVYIENNKISLKVENIKSDINIENIEKYKFSREKLEFKKI